MEEEMEEEEEEEEMEMEIVMEMEMEMEEEEKKEGEEKEDEDAHDPYLHATQAGHVLGGQAVSQLQVGAAGVIIVVIGRRESAVVLRESVDMHSRPSVSVIILGPSLHDASVRVRRMHPDLQADQRTGVKVLEC
ncbi:hypothetical protein Pmani_028475 [Petrolisthes manimaculis]|uniref:Uncharacterized protein n=1 Tax=Petrolisthes manimaculis TaxID=1843537 RepID=A0AAE1TUU9_9EUCA|nr:hypothetical protein Pmani_028475 [Petrolisthes manimaculis]